MKLKLFVIILFITISLSAKEVKIALSSNVSYAIEALKKEFNSLYPDIKVQVILGSSGKLTAQIRNKAPYHIFMSADMKYPDALLKEGIAITKPVVYAQGTLAYLSSKKQDFTKKMHLLKTNKIDKIAIANPKTAPYGKAAVEAMQNAGVYESVKDKFVFAESISGTLSFVIIAADIGFIAKSSLYSSKMSHFKKGINWIDVDVELYTPIDQGIVVLKNGELDSDVYKFYNFILSQKAKKIFRDFGYLVPLNSEF